MRKLWQLGFSVKNIFLFEYIDVDFMPKDLSVFKQRRAKVKLAMTIDFTSYVEIRTENTVP